MVARDLRGARPRRAASACSTSAPAPATRRRCSRSSPTRSSRSSACPSSRTRRGGRSSAPGYERVDVRVGDGTLGVPEQAPFDGIAVAAAAPAVPEALYEQLAPGGASSSRSARGATSGSRSSNATPDGPGPGADRAVPVRPADRLGRVRRSRGRVERLACEGRRLRCCCACPCSRAGSVSARWRTCSSTRTEPRILGLEVHCGDGASRFLPFSTARRGEHGIEIDSTFTLLDSRELEFYRAARPFARRRARARRRPDRGRTARS